MLRQAGRDWAKLPILLNSDSGVDPFFPKSFLFLGGYTPESDQELVAQADTVFVSQEVDAFDLDLDGDLPRCWLDGCFTEREWALSCMGHPRTWRK